MLSAINKELFCVSVPSRYQILKHGGFWLNCGFPPSLIFFFSSLSLGSSSFSSPHLVFRSSSWSHHSGTPGLQNIFNLNFKPLGLWQFFSNLNINFCGSSWPVEGTMGSRRASSQHDVSWELHFFFHQLMLGSHVGKLFVLQRRQLQRTHQQWKVYSICTITWEPVGWNLTWSGFLNGQFFPFYSLLSSFLSSFTQQWEGMTVLLRGAKYKKGTG